MRLHIRYWNLFFQRHNVVKDYILLQDYNYISWFTNYNLRINNFCRFKYEYAFYDPKRDRQLKSYFICG